MKILNCHIENFGALSSLDYNFRDGINALYSPNGGGKSTLAAFIKAMFYGLPSDSSRSRFNERRHYYPFSGGKFGGNLTFEFGGEVYRIERFFDRTSGDDTKVYLRGSLLREFSDGAVGYRFFGLDEQSFARTLFISSDAGELSSTDSINAKLGEYASAVAGEYDAGAAVETLEKACKNLQARGGKGEIPRLEAQIKRCRADLSNIDAVSARLGEKYQKSSQLAAQLAAIENEERRMNTAAVTAEKWARYDAMRSDIERKRARLDELKAAYPAGFPTDEELSVLNAAALAFPAERPRPDPAPAPNQKSGRIAAAVSFLLCIVMLIAGIVLMAFNTFVGVAALAAGALFLIATLCVMFMGKNGKKSSRAPSADGAMPSRADGVLQKYGLKGDYAAVAARVSRDRYEYSSLFSEAARGEDAARAYARENDLVQRPVGGAQMPSGAEELRRALAALDRDISDDESIVETLGERQAELESAQAELEECKRKFADYTAAAQFISEAARTLNMGYLKPVGEAFLRYSALLKSVLGGKIYLDKNFSVSFEGGGELRPDGHLSGGQRAVVSLCFRLALIDNLFGSELPFVVLDDPFADLDEEHMRRAAGLLHELSAGRQIIYFYCHKSRAV